MPRILKNPKLKRVVPKPREKIKSGDYGSLFDSGKFTSLEQKEFMRLREGLVRATAHANRAGTGVDLHQQRVLMEQLKAFIKLVDVRRSTKSGTQPETLARQYGVTPRTIQRWASGEIHPKALYSHKLAEKYAKKRVPLNLKEIINNPTKAKSLGYLVGSFMGNLNDYSFGHVAKLRADVATKSFAESISKAIKDVSGNNPKTAPIITRTSGGWTTYKVIVNYANLLEYLNRVTGKRNRTPTKLLQGVNGKAIRQGYLEAIVDSYYSINQREGLWINIPKPYPRQGLVVPELWTQQMKRDVSILLSEKAIETFSGKDGKLIIKRTKANYERFLKEIGSHSEELKRKVNSLLRDLP